MEISTSHADLTRRIAERSRSMAGWLKFLGIVTVISAAPAALSIVGLVIAWLPIWLGVLLVQAGNAADSGTDDELLRMIEKLRTYFVIQCVMIIVMVVAFGLFFAFFGTFFFDMMREIGTQVPTWQA